jgi:hypothetical protein
MSWGRSALARSGCTVETCGMDTVVCDRCGKLIRVRLDGHPVIVREDPATENQSAQHVMIGRDWLLHRCEIRDNEGVG